MYLRFEYKGKNIERDSLRHLPRSEEKHSIARPRLLAEATPSGTLLISADSTFVRGKLSYNDSLPYDLFQSKRAPWNYSIRCRFNARNCYNVKYFGLY